MERVNTILATSISLSLADESESHSPKLALVKLNKRGGQLTRGDPLISPSKELHQNV